MSHAAQFLHDNPSMRKNLHQESTRPLLTSAGSFTNPLLHSNNQDDDNDANSGGGGGAGEEEIINGHKASEPLPHDALRDVLAEFGEESLFWKVTNYSNSSKCSNSYTPIYLHLLTQKAIAAHTHTCHVLYMGILY
jgi:hypothetical protein